MALEKLLQDPNFTLVSGPADCSLSKVFCCDLLSVAMSRAPEGGIWITVMNNLNTLAVASLCEVHAVVLAENVMPQEDVIQRAGLEGISLISTPLPIFEAAVAAQNYLD